MMSSSPSLTFFGPRTTEVHHNPSTKTHSTHHSQHFDSERPFRFNGRCPRCPFGEKRLSISGFLAESSPSTRRFRVHGLTIQASSPRASSTCPSKSGHNTRCVTKKLALVSKEIRTRVHEKLDTCLSLGFPPTLRRSVASPRPTLGSQFCDFCPFYGCRQNRLCATRFRMARLALRAKSPD